MNDLNAALYDLDAPEVRERVEENLRKIETMGIERRAEQAARYSTRDDIDCAKQFLIGMMKMMDEPSVGTAGHIEAMLATLAIMVRDIRAGEKLRRARS